MIKWSDVKVGVSPLSNSIYIGKTKQMKGRPEIEEWVDRSGDKTEEVLLGVVQYFIYTNKPFVFKYKGKTHTLSLEIKEEE